MYTGINTSTDTRGILPVGPVHNTPPWLTWPVVFNSPSGAKAQNTSSTQSSVGWQNSTLSRQLDKDHGQQVGPGCSGRVQVGAHESSLPVTPSSNSGPAGPGVVDRSGSTEPDQQRSGVRGSPFSSERRLLLNTILSAQEGRPTQTSSQLKTTQQIYEGGALQDGGYAHSARPSSRGRLDDSARLEGCLLCYSGQTTAPEVSPIQVEKSQLPVQITPIWPVHSSSSVYKDFAPSGRSVKEDGDQMCYLSGRHPHHESRQRASSSTDVGCSRLAGSIRIFGELPEVSAGANTGNYIPWVCVGLEQERGEASSIESISDTAGSTASPITRKSFSEGPSKLHRQAVSSHIGNLPSSPSLLKSPATEASSTSNVQFRSSNDDLTSSSRRPSLVDEQFRELEWKSNPGIYSRDGNRDRCFEDGLGSLLHGRVYRGLLVSGGENASHQCPRVDGSNIWDTSLLQRQTSDVGTVEDRQFNSSVIR